MACSVLTQSTPAVGRAGSTGSVTLNVVSSLLGQWEDTRWSRDAAAGRSLIGARWVSDEANHFNTDIVPRVCG